MCIRDSTLNRARKPALESYDNALKSLGGWMGLADRAQSEEDRLDRFFKAPDILKGFTGADMQAAARKYLAKDDAVEIIVAPKKADDAEPAEPAGIIKPSAPPIMSE